MSALPLSLQASLQASPPSSSQPSPRPQGASADQLIPTAEQWLASNWPLLVHLAHDDDDAVQQAAIRLWQRWWQFRLPPEATTPEAINLALLRWAGRVIRNEVINVWRWRQRHQRHEIALSSWWRTDDGADDAASDELRFGEFLDQARQEEQLIGRDASPEQLAIDHQLLQDSWAKATRDERILVLLVYQGYTMDEIGQRTGLPSGTVKTRLRRLRQRLWHLWPWQDQQAA